MRKLRIALVITLGLCSINELSWARAYVTDSFKITMRTGPSMENKIITMLSSGEPLEVLESGDDWTRVRVLDSEGNQKEGWVLSRFLMERQPWEAQARGLSKENASLKEELATIEKKWSQSSDREGELQKELQDTSETLNQVRADFEALKSESSDFLKFKEEYEALKSTLQSAQETVQKLTEENEILSSSENVKWFLTGASVFFCAWLIGLIIGRREKKRRTSFSGLKG